MKNFVQKIYTSKVLNHCMTSILHVTYGQLPLCGWLDLLVSLLTLPWVIESHCKFWNLVIGRSPPTFFGLLIKNRGKCLFFWKQSYISRCKTSENHWFWNYFLYGTFWLWSIFIHGYGKSLCKMSMGKIIFC